MRSETRRYIRTRRENEQDKARTALRCLNANEKGVHLDALVVRE